MKHGEKEKKKRMTKRNREGELERKRNEENIPVIVPWTRWRKKSSYVKSNFKNDER